LSIVFTGILVRILTCPAGLSGLHRLYEWLETEAQTPSTCSEGKDGLGIATHWISLVPALRLLMSQSLSTTAFQGPCPQWQDLVGGILGGSWVLTKSTCDSLKRRHQRNWVTMTPRHDFLQNKSLQLSSSSGVRDHSYIGRGLLFFISHLARLSIVAASQELIGKC
jgi:hypothetical protein